MSSIEFPNPSQETPHSMEPPENSGKTGGRPSLQSFTGNTLSCIKLTPLEITLQVKLSSYANNVWLLIIIPILLLLL